MPPSRVLRGRVLACRPSSPLTTYSRPGPRGSPTARTLAATPRPPRARGSRPAAEAERARARRAAFPSARRASVYAAAPVCDATPGRRRAVSPRFELARIVLFTSISFSTTRTQAK